MKPSQLIKFKESPKEIDLERRAREAEETFRRHKQKSWMTTGGTLDRPKLFGDDPEHAKLIPGGGKGEPLSPDLAVIKRFLKDKK